jgi:hypothetical protein
MIQLIGLGKEHGFDRLRAAVESCISMGCWDPAAITRSLTMGARAARRQPSDCGSEGARRSRAGFNYFPARYPAAFFRKVTTLGAGVIVTARWPQSAPSGAIRLAPKRCRR